MASAADRLRILVVDDTVTFRKVLSDLLRALPGIEVVGTAANGKIALQKVDSLKPDLLTLDLEMPELDGLGVLEALRESGRRVGVIMLSAFTTAGAESTVAALKLGAFDFVVKPSSGNPAEGVEALRRELVPKVEAFGRTHGVRKILSGGGPAGGSSGGVAAAPRRPSAERGSAVVRPPGALRATDAVTSPQVIAIGISTGGPQALSQVLPRLPGTLGVPVLVVQHMPPKFTRSLATDLDVRCALNVVEAEDGQAVRPGTVFIAPGGRQMKVGRSSGGLVIRITDDPPEQNCRPSVDYLFRSVSQECRGAAVGVVMTGMGSDGTLGARLLKRQGALIIAQDEETCVVFGMPKFLVEEGLADAVLPLAEIAPTLTRIGTPRVSVCK